MPVLNVYSDFLIVRFLFFKEKVLTQVWKCVTAFKERLAFPKGAGILGC